MRSTDFTLTFDGVVWTITCVGEVAADLAYLIGDYGCYEEAAIELKMAFTEIEE
jgi:hypothetical protein